MSDKIEKNFSETVDSKTTNTFCDLRQKFDKQYSSNLEIKNTMFKELEAMEIPENIIRQILNLEDEPPF